jgi:endonuclease/exonuclease/phosphatase family metal-dependent hydrolase
MLIATWNLNNRVGKVRFRPEAANAAIKLGADILIFNEYYPQEHSIEFCRALYDAGWSYQEESKNIGEKANRILIAARLPIQPLDIHLPDFDKQFSSNVLCVRVPSVNISIIGVRVPWYIQKESSLIFKAWDWLESVSTSLIDQPSIILGDLNVGLKSPSSRGGEHFRRILNSGWHRAIPRGSASFYSNRGSQSEIDHILGSSLCKFSHARYITQLNGYLLAGKKDAISDHAVLLAELDVLNKAV